MPIDNSDIAGVFNETEEAISKAIESRAQVEKRFMISKVRPVVDSIIGFLKQVPGVTKVVVAGSYRRSKETVGDLDILVTARKNSPVMRRFLEYDAIDRVLVSGETKTSVVMHSGLQIDIRLVAPASFGAALHYFTGSKDHNIAIRRLGQQRGLKINEYGVFRFEDQVAGRTEASVYQVLDLPLIPPELRENRGEIEAAAEKRLPKLIERKDIQGDLHVHTDASDGRNTLEEMVRAARQQGLKYIAITEHSGRLKFAGGLDASRLMRQIDEIDHLNEKLKGIRILKGLEAEILKDGKLDVPEDALARLDLVVGTVHTHFDLTLEKQTTRILRAMDQRYFSMLAHPTGRKINQRDPYQVDLIRIIQKARERGCFLELNANPKRLDLTDIYCQMARAERVLISINSDAHSIDAYNEIEFGIGQARRGWLEKKDVLNTRSLTQLIKLLKQTMVS